MKSKFDSDVETDILEGEGKTGQQKSSVEGSREAKLSSSSPSHSHQIAFSSELPFSKTREVW